MFDKISDLPDLNDTMYIFTAVKDLSRRVRKGVEAYDLVLVFLCDETDIPALQYANCFFVKERMFFEDEIQTNNCTLYIDDIRKLPQHFSTLCKARISAVKENRITHIYYKEFNRAISYFSKALKQKFRNAEFRKYFGVQDLPTVLPSFQSNEFVLLLTDEVGFREMEEYLIHQLRNNVKFLSICIPKSKEFAKLCKRQSHRAPIIWFTENETRDIYFVLKSIQSFIRYKKWCITSIKYWSSNQSNFSWNSKNNAFSFYLNSSNSSSWGAADKHNLPASIFSKSSWKNYKFSWMNFILFFPIPCPKASMLP